MASKVQQKFNFSAAANYTSAAVDCEDCSTVSIQLVGTSLAKADGKIALQRSNDGTNFEAVATATTVAATATAYGIADTAAAYRFYRAVWAKGTNAAGTCEVILFAKPNR